MVADGMLTRKRYREVPPRVDYELTERARDLMPVLGELARWGYEWAWSNPRNSESVDVGAIFRLAPGLLAGAEASGTVQFAVEDERHTTYTFTLSEAGVRLQEQQVQTPDASVRGPVSAWIGAFSPSRERDGLTLTGDSELAGKLLDALAGVTPGRAAPSARAAA